jgi:hypothetical protein
VLKKNNAKIMMPKPFCFNKSKIKAFVLGADPTNFSDHGKPVQIDTVFAIGSGDHRCFDGILKNLEAIELGLKDIYVQNLIQEPLESETAKNKDWEIHAENWLSITKVEFDKVDPSKKIPVLVTAERIMKFLYPEVPPAKDIYSGTIAVPFVDNLLGRPLFAFYRHYEYALSKNRFKKFIIQFKKLINKEL